MIGAATTTTMTELDEEDRALGPMELAVEYAASAEAERDLLATLPRRLAPRPAAPPRWQRRKRRRDEGPPLSSPVWSQRAVAEALAELTPAERGPLRNWVLARRLGPVVGPAGSPPLFSPASFRCGREHPLFVQGRYRKLSRWMPQSAWVIDGERRGTASVEEVLCEALREAAHAESVTFQAAGREDMDVRMLGRGRPFILEARQARRLPSLEELAAAVSSASAAQGAPLEAAELAVADADAAGAMHAMAETKRKAYRALVWSSAALSEERVGRVDGLRDVLLRQKTPIRVLHTRSAAVRERTVHSLSLRPINAHFAILDMTTAAGTYIKEFVHGDLGRTQPNLGTLLGGDADIIQLDVADILDGGADAE